MCPRNLKVQDSAILSSKQWTSGMNVMAAVHSHDRNGSMGWLVVGIDSLLKAITGCFPRMVDRLHDI